MIVKKGCGFDYDFDPTTRSLKLTLNGEIDHHSAKQYIHGIEGKISRKEAEALAEYVNSL